MNFKAVFFDLDGTLLNTIDDISDAINAAMKKNTLPEHSVNECLGFVGGGTTRMLQMACPPNIAPELFASVVEAYFKAYEDNMYNKTRPYADILKVLGELKRMGLKTAIISNKYDLAIKAIAERYFIDTPFDAVTGSLADKPTKPSLDLGVMMCDRLGLSPDEVVFIGDSDVDMIFAKNAGFFPLGAGWGYRTVEELYENGAERVLQNPVELLEILNEGRLINET